MKKNIFLTLLFAAIVCIPLLTYGTQAQGAISIDSTIENSTIEVPEAPASSFTCTFDLSNLNTIILSLLCVFDWLVPALISIGLVVFLWGMSKYATAGADEEKIKSGRDMMVYGIIGLFVMVSLWGIVSIIMNIFFSGDSPDLDEVIDRVQSTVETDN